MGMSSDLIKPLKTSLASQLLYLYSFNDSQAHFKGGCLVNEKNSTSDKKVLNVFIVFYLDSTSHDFHSWLKNCLFR